MPQPTRAPVNSEDFLAWKEHPVSQWVMAALRTQAEALRREWLSQTWGTELSGPTPKPDPDLLLALVVLKTRADAYVSISETSYERLCELHGNDPATE